MASLAAGRQKTVSAPGRPPVGGLPRSDGRLQDCERGFGCPAASATHRAGKRTRGRLSRHGTPGFGLRPRGIVAVAADTEAAESVAFPAIVIVLAGSQRYGNVDAPGRGVSPVA